MALSTNPFSSAYNQQEYEYERMKREIERHRMASINPLTYLQMQAAQQRAFEGVKANTDPTPNPVLLLTGEDE